jgi:hypothetical protein
MHHLKTKIKITKQTGSGKQRERSLPIMDLKHNLKKCFFHVSIHSGFNMAPLGRPFCLLALGPYRLLEKLFIFSRTLFILTFCPESILKVEQT